MSEFDDLIADLKKKRDELRVQVNLGSKEAKEEFGRLEQRLETFLNDATQQAKQELENTGKELRAGLERLRDRLKS